jgi:hypothetical protein
VTDERVDAPQPGRLSDYLCLGVVSRIYRRDLVDEVIAETRSKEKRNRLLPARLVVYYVIALALFFGEAYEEVMRRMVGGLRFVAAWEHAWQVPTPRRCVRHGSVSVRRRCGGYSNVPRLRWPHRRRSAPGRDHGG